MSTVKKVVAMSGEEYQKLKEKAQAYDTLLAEQPEINKDSNTEEKTTEMH